MEYPHGLTRRMTPDTSDRFLRAMTKSTDELLGGAFQ